MLSIVMQQLTLCCTMGCGVISFIILHMSLPHSTVALGLKLNKENPTNHKAKCDLCREIYTKFKQGLKSTEKSNFGGGNTKWEEKSLGKYRFSETRLVEIMEHLCEKSNQECHQLVEQNEEYIEDYWSSVFRQEKPTDFFLWFCIDNIKVCCPNGTYGSDCTPCPGGARQPCNSHGTCHGDGTREGKGSCWCNKAYMGDMCDECHTSFYPVVENTTHILCEACDVSCKDSCTGQGPTSCDTCSQGYVWDESLGCVDIDECDKDPGLCEGKTYCLNNAGSYECINCDEACMSCTGGGSKFCLACNPGYQLEDGVCMDIDECHDGSLCQGDNEKCENTKGSHFCGCLDGFIRSNDACIPKPEDTPKMKPYPKKQSKTKLPAPGMVLYFIILTSYGLLGGMTQGSVVLMTPVTTFMASYLFWFSSQFDHL